SRCSRPPLRCPPRFGSMPEGSVATLKMVTEIGPRLISVSKVSGRQIEQPVDEMILFTNIIAADPPRLPLPDHVHRFVSFNRSPGCLDLTKVLLGLHSSFDGSMILLQDIVQILDRSMSTAAPEDSFLFHCWNRRPVEARPIGVDYPRLWM